MLIKFQDIFRLDLEGVRVLVPAYVSALEIILPDKDLKLPLNVSKVELRRSSIHLLLSMIVLPLHFQNVCIKELTTLTGTHHAQSLTNTVSHTHLSLFHLAQNDRPTTFAQLKPRLMNLVMNALQVESDPQNTHMLLGCLSLCVQDAAAFESVEQVTQPTTETASNLLSSGKTAPQTKNTKLILREFLASFSFDWLLFYCFCIGQD